MEEEGCWVVAVVVCGCSWWGNGGGDSVEARGPITHLTRNPYATKTHGHATTATQSIDESVEAR